ncbi:acyl-CoA dehydrogenase [Oleiphilus sp. HI0081]|nr:acyl-CoA dehydrogenase [Oleiphilus sp. HI0043]KZY41165.1 acyl-CoA dehydrogenase [Oleiphilus sp. HI0050]KZY62800.1 acyl-CoA dehydrogenase [Oleiphilus sp. HI0061]KZY75966.1 acyl-CoA dehydrogenase [Oleiphilus sp. HI0068]KZY78621.1 acyl-CoA dehydrogenase [Oleiphilus sp. HI0069]KZY88555.1 acyl-CoA dehydrogenase [Oleiphilus sp. HI0072]KZZ28391.1 acyl-CoA dehydrogenase [Oleiphilus sp. HI0081]KZZ33207.1 acyl-CoA dehydrogenase [Oleiphilus sp. HI0085]KZZ34270.1 acyl-CoA dehydrogenase [Oleiphilus s
MSNARAVVSHAQNALNTSLSHIKHLCLNETGRLSGHKLDEYQVVSYDLAYASAEIAAASSICDYAEKIRASKGEQEELYLEETIALMFCAEAVQSTKARLATKPREFGLSKEQFAESFDNDAVVDFCDTYLQTAKLVELGKIMLGQDGCTTDPLLDEDKEIMRESFQRFATDVVMPKAEHIHREDLMVPDEILKPLVEMGCFGLSIPERYDGLQPDDREDNMGMIVVTEELSRGSLAAAGSLITRPEILSKALMAGGTEEQKQYWLPKLAWADPSCAVAITEPDFGSDVAGMKLKAEKVDGGWVLNGAKTWCTFGGKAGVLLTLARTNPDPGLGHKGLSMFLVEKPSFDGHDFEYEQEGGGKLSGKAIPTIGYRGMHSFDVFFDNVFVPDSHLLGGEEGLGKGFYYTMAGFSGGRIQTAARANGLMQAAYERAISYSQERKVFGQPVGEYQLTLSKLSRMATLMTASRQFTYAVGRLMDEGKGQMEASLVKLFACKSSEWLTREALQIHGGMGYAEESAVSRYWIDARVLSIFEGAEETLALKVIARTLIENAA